MAKTIKIYHNFAFGQNEAITVSEKIVYGNLVMTTCWTCARTDSENMCRMVSYICVTIYCKFKSDVWLVTGMGSADHSKMKTRLIYAESFQHHLLGVMKKWYENEKKKKTPGNMWPAKRRAETAGRQVFLIHLYKGDTEWHIVLILNHFLVCPSLRYLCQFKDICVFENAT